MPQVSRSGGLQMSTHHGRELHHPGDRGPPSRSSRDRRHGRGSDPLRKCLEVWEETLSGRFSDPLRAERGKGEKESQNHSMVWVGRDLTDHPVPPPCHEQGHLPPAQGAQRTARGKKTR